MDIAAPTHRPRAATRPLLDLEAVVAPTQPQPERTHLIDVRAARALAEHVDAFDAAETVGLGMRLPPGDLMEVRSLTAETLDPFAGYTPPPPTPVPPVAPLPGIPTSVTFELSDGLSGSTLPVPPSAWTTPSVVPAPPPSSLPPAYLSAQPPPGAMVTPQAWPSFRPRPAEESLPLPPRDPLSLADGRSGAFDRTFVQAAIVGVLVLSLLAVMLSAR
jgi:hypothetical protein